MHHAQKAMQTMDNQHMACHLSVNRAPLFLVNVRQFVDNSCCGHRENFWRRGIFSTAKQSLSLAKLVNNFAFYQIWLPIRLGSNGRNGASHVSLRPGLLTPDFDSDWFGRMKRNDYSLLLTK